MVEYKVQLEVFEGPLDLLLYLIRKEEVDIYEVNLTKIATQFIAHVEMMRQLDLEVAGEFLVMAATLMYIKSRELLPVERQVVVEGEDEDAMDPRWDLIRQLVEYKKFKDMAAVFQEREARQENIYTRIPAKAELPEPETTGKPEVSLFDLINAVSAVLKRHQEKGDVGTISEDKWPVSEKIAYLRDLITSRSAVRFSELFMSSRSRSEVVATFLAMLELIRLKVLMCAQSEAFGEIEIQARPPEAKEEKSASGESDEPAASAVSPEETPVVPEIPADAESTESPAT